eukprot:s902_g28.t1
MAAWGKGKGKSKGGGSVVGPRAVLPRREPLSELQPGRKRAALSLGGGSCFQAAGRAPGPAARPAAPAAVGAVPGSGAANATPPPITVSGCQNVTIANIIKGSYTPSGSNHNKPIYQKEPRASGGRR